MAEDEAPLTGRHALVTGAGRGIGRAVALGLARQGAALTLVARDSGELEASAEACRLLGSPSVACESLDLLDREELAQLADSAAVEADVLVNNAGSAPSAPLERTDDDLFDDTLGLNLFAPFALCRAALPAMAARGFGRIVNLASTAALAGFAYTSAYVASKHALLGLTRALAVEARQRWPSADLSVNAVCPGFVDTALLGRAVERLSSASGLSSEAARARLAAMNPGGRLLTPEDVAAAVCGLALERPATSHGRALEFGAR